MTTMRALHAYAKSDPSQLILEEAPLPEFGAQDVLVQVYASGVSPGELDWPTAWLHHDGTERQLPIVPGHEVAGVVRSIGPRVTDFAVGDEVFGFIDIRRDGADAEYVAVTEVELAHKPHSLTHAQAAALPLSALTAWQALFDQGRLERGQRVLVHGGGGGVGTYAVQLARWGGARVVATSSARDEALVRDLGADEVIDYRTTRFEEAVADLDLVIDTVGGDTWERSWGVLRPGGTLVSIAVPRPADREPANGQAIWFVVTPNRHQLQEIAALAASGRLRPIVSAVLPLARGAEAYGSSAPRGAPGKVVLLVAAASSGEVKPGSGSFPVRVSVR